MKSTSYPATSSVIAKNFNAQIIPSNTNSIIASDLEAIGAGIPGSLNATNLMEPSNISMKCNNLHAPIANTHQNNNIPSISQV